MNDAQTFEAMAGALVERGIMTADQVAAERTLRESPDAEAEALGGTASAPGPQGEAQESADPLDAMAFRGANSPAEYQFNHGNVPEGAEPAPEFERSMRTLFHEQGVPASLGNQFAKWYDEAHRQPFPEGPQRDINRQSATLQLQKMWGEEFEANLALAEAELGRWEKARPGLAEVVRVTGMAHNAHLIATLANFAKGKGRSA